MTSETTAVSHPPEAEPAAAAPRLLSKEHLPVAIGIVALVTLGAFENRAVMSIMPTAARALDGLAWFGPANAASMVTFMVAVAVGGRWVDRAGSKVVLLWGLATFLVAQAVTASAPTMAVLIAGRGISGLAEGLIDVALLVFAARALPEQLRAKVFATFAAAWILPSVLGPGAAGAAEALVGWRLVFLLPAVLVLPATLLILPALRRPASRVRAPEPALSEPALSATALSEPAGAETAAASGAEVNNPDGPDSLDNPNSPDSAEATSTRQSLRAALGLATSVALLSVGGSLAFEGGSGDRFAGLTAIVLGALGLAATIRGALPRGTLTVARGIPALVALRIILVIAFGGVGAYLPLMLDVTHGAGPAVAGISMSITGVFWALGSAIHSLDVVQARTDAASRVGLGLALITLGGLAPLLLSLDLVGLVPGMAGWAVAATGMGLASPSLATEVFALAPEREQGQVTAATQIGASLGSTLTTVVGGALIAARATTLDGGVFAVIIGSALALSAIGAALAHRLRP